MLPAASLPQIMHHPTEVIQDTLRSVRATDTAIWDETDTARLLIIQSKFQRSCRFVPGVQEYAQRCPAN